jgi:hypothetical protein
MEMRRRHAARESLSQVGNSESRVQSQESGVKSNLKFKVKGQFKVKGNCF